MIIFNSLDEIKNIQPCIVALGNFDGIHLGHQGIIKKAVADAREDGVKSAIFTFSNHPRNLVEGEKGIKNILYQEDKQRIVESLGVDYYFNLPFDSIMMKMSPEDFIDKILIDIINAKGIMCGFNYNFGYKGKGNVELLIKQGSEKDFSVHVAKPFTVDGEVVSSSLIRENITIGNMKKCRALLGRYYSIGGEVVVGNRLGKTIGFPTSNLNIDDGMVSPPNGVYRTLCIYNNVVCPSITNVGRKPTIGEYCKNIETHIFNFDKELYGKNIRVEFIEKMRDEVKFDSIERLSEAIRRDCNEAKKKHEEEGRIL